MKEIPENIQDNEHLVALKALQDDEDLNVTAESLCTLGSDFIKKNSSNSHYLKAAY